MMAVSLFGKRFPSPPDSTQPISVFQGKGENVVADIL